jgi:HK97 family phage major capsid protein
MSSHKLHQLKQSRSVLTSQQVQLTLANQVDSPAFKKLEDELRNVESDINLLEKLENMMTADERARLPKQISDAATSAVRSAMPSAISSFVNTQENPEQRKAKLNAQVRNLLMKRNPSQEEVRDLLTTSDATGAALIPQEFAASAMATALKFYGPVGNYVAKFAHNTGAPTKFSLSDDTNAVMFLVSESGDSGVTEQDPAVSSTIPGTSALVASIRYSVQADPRRPCNRAGDHTWNLKPHRYKGRSYHNSSSA